jgi:hypothetical protein
MWHETQLLPALDMAGAPAEHFLSWLLPVSLWQFLQA